MVSSLRDQVSALTQLGARRTAWRIARELRLRTGAYAEAQPSPEVVAHAIDPGKLAGLPFESKGRVAEVMAGRLPASNRRQLVALAESARLGKILAFGRWTADYGYPVDWHKNPTNGRQWRRDLPWSRVLRDEPVVGDVKMTWEIGRFPHAYHLARAATHDPERAPEFAGTFQEHVLGFLANNPFPNGVHWNSGQELVIRHIAWRFALGTFQGEVSTSAAIARSLAEVGAHLAKHFEYAQRAVYNNHLIAEALGLYLFGRLFAGTREGDTWRSLGLLELERQTTRQFTKDGAYIQNAHNYHRGVLQYYLLATRLLDVDGIARPATLTGALERSLDFLVAHQNPSDGRLPNYGSNDGSMPFVLSTCDFNDMRPTLQAVSLCFRGERLYEPGPWDEEAAWLVGADSLERPLRPPARTSVCFDSGYNVLRSPGSFASFRCGSVTDRFSQIDMLAVDFWWRGQNVLIDAGSYQYNGPARWHDHFMRTACHNTVMVDDDDQMVHLRRFTLIHWTKARVLDFRTDATHTICTGEHYGYQRLRGRPVHRRSVLLAGDDLLVVADTILGAGPHAVRLHWLCGAFKTSEPQGAGPVTLSTPNGDLDLAVYDDAGGAQAIELVQGDEATPRGWSSRYYGERSAVPSLSVSRTANLPVSLLTIVCPHEHVISRKGDTWSVGPSGSRFTVRAGALVFLSPSETPQ